ncbi:hypothetical protein ACT17_15295 [Mycolicibacterium conceptionense]|uniref:Uncharacterized protein n=2 Tax=Mycolicibacterium conceptionense TaxID=451644 RepID=A0A0J8U9F4_9MYCO|nr:hypothetical protein ACT17_15295 [Mycolicibacterium conceptionense]
MAGEAIGEVLARPRAVEQSAYLNTHAGAAIAAELDRLGRKRRQLTIAAGQVVDRRAPSTMSNRAARRRAARHLRSDR